MTRRALEEDALRQITSLQDKLAKSALRHDLVDYFQTFMMFVAVVEVAVMIWW